MSSALKKRNILHVISAFALTRTVTYREASLCVIWNIKDGGILPVFSTLFPLTLSTSFTCEVIHSSASNVVKAFWDSWRTKAGGYVFLTRLHSWFCYFGWHFFSTVEIKMFCVCLWDLYNFNGPFFVSRKRMNFVLGLKNRKKNADKHLMTDWRWTCIKLMHSHSIFSVRDKKSSWVFSTQTVYKDQILDSLLKSSKVWIINLEIAVMAYCRIGSDIHYITGQIMGLKEKVNCRRMWLQGGQQVCR